MGEFLASLFHAMGIFTEQYLNTSAAAGQAFHPQSFSSTHTAPKTKTLLRFNSAESGSATASAGARVRSPKVLPITDSSGGGSGRGKSQSNKDSQMRFTQISDLNHTPLARRDLKKKFALWYERDLLMTSS
jgi:hypothetical protein